MGFGLNGFYYVLEYVRSMVQLLYKLDDKGYKKWKVLMFSKN